MDLVSIIIEPLIQFAPIILIMIIVINVIKRGLEWLKDFIKN